MPRPDEPKPSKPEPTNAPTGSTEDRVRDAVAKLIKTSEGWAGIVDVHKALGDVDHDELSRVLVDMARNDSNVHLVPEDNRKALRQEDHDTAVYYSGKPQHLIQILRPLRRSRCGPASRSPCCWRSTPASSTAESRPHGGRSRPRWARAGECGRTLAAGPRIRP